MTASMVRVQQLGKPHGLLCSCRMIHTRWCPCSAPRAPISLSAMQADNWDRAEQHEIREEDAPATNGMTTTSRRMTMQTARLPRTRAPTPLPRSVIPCKPGRSRLQLSSLCQPRHTGDNSHVQNAQHGGLASSS